MELQQYIAIAKRWWWLMVLMTVVAGVTSYAVSQRQVPVYEATTALLVGQSIQATELSTGDILSSQWLAQTYADLAHRQPVLQGVIETLSLNDTEYELQKRVRARPVPDTQLLEISVEASSPEEARATADEVARQLILLSPTALKNEDQNENQRFVRQRLEGLQGKIEAGQTRVKELEAAMADSLSAQQVQELQSEINTLESLMAEWENTYTQLLIFIESKESPNYLTVVEPAQVNPDPIRPQSYRNTGIASIVGLMLALGLVFLLEYLDDTLKSVDDLGQVLGLTALGTVSRMRGKHYQNKVITDQNPFSAVSEVYRIIRSNIQFMSIDRPLKSILVASAGPGEGKSITTANLGMVMAQAGLKTIVVDTDLRRPVQHQILKVPNTRGLTDLLRSPELDVDSYLRQTRIENLQVVTSGALPPNPAELLGSQRMGQLLDRLNEMADVLIFDSPPVVVVTDAAVLSSRLDGVVLVIESGHTRRDMARQAVKNLQQAGANMLGVVLNRVSGKSGGHYYNHYYSSKRPEAVGQPAQPNQ